MTLRAWALGAAVAIVVLSVAQDVVPGLALYHSWQYASVLAVALAVVLRYTWLAARGRDARFGRRLVLAAAGAAAVALAGLAAGLLGPDTARIVGTPGTVVPIPALSAAAAFAAADAETIARGDGSVVLRRRSAPALAIGEHGAHPLGESILFLEGRPAAYVDARDRNGAHLTVTQPVNASFLSPVLLFERRQQIGALNLAFDTFALPGVHRVVRAFYVDARTLRALHHGSGPAQDALLLSMTDDAGAQVGITIAYGGRETQLGGVRIRATLGRYPALAIASVPPAWALALGIAALAAGLAWAALPPRPAPGTVALQS